MIFYIDLCIYNFNFTKIFFIEQQLILCTNKIKVSNYFIQIVNYILTFLKMIYRCLCFILQHVMFSYY